MKKPKVLIGLVGLLVLGLIFGACRGVSIPSTKQPNTKMNEAYDASAQATLRTAVAAAEMYAANQDGSYAGMNAAALSQLEENVKFTDGAAGENVVSIEASADSYEMSIKSKSGKVFKATKKAGGTVEFNFD